MTDTAALREALIAEQAAEREREIAAGVRAPIYRGYHIYYDPPPIPVRTSGWHFYHDDYDGAEDSRDRRCGSAASPEECRAEIDWIEDD